jgi:hypothetical protein
MKGFSAMITKWTVRGVNAHNEDVWQVGVEADGPKEAVRLAEEIRDDTLEGLYDTAENDPAAIGPRNERLRSIKGWRLQGPPPWD